MANWNPEPARVFPPGRVIERELAARGWTQQDLARVMGRPRRFIGQLVRGQKRITERTALELAEAFGVSSELWLNLEQRSLGRSRGSIPRIPSSAAEPS